MKERRVGITCPPMETQLVKLEKDFFIPLSKEVLAYIAIIPHEDAIVVTVKIDGSR